MSAAERVFDRYQEAPERAGTDLAEKFLRAAVQSPRGDLADRSARPRAGGRRQLDHQNRPQGPRQYQGFYRAHRHDRGQAVARPFLGPPFGWSPDTMRYMVAALLVAGEVKLKVSGREVTVTGQQAIDALKTNNSVQVGRRRVARRQALDGGARQGGRTSDRPVRRVRSCRLRRTSARRRRNCCRLYSIELAPLAERLQALGLPGVETVRSVNQQIADMLLSDASDAPQRFGAEQSPLYDGLKWAMAARLALDQGLGDTVRELRDLAGASTSCPPPARPGTARGRARGS